MKLIIVLSFVFSSVCWGKPTGWTCTRRTATINALAGSVSCTGNEKVIKGGCSLDQSGFAPLASFPIGQGWSCAWNSSSTQNIVYANCCL